MASLKKANLRPVHPNLITPAQIAEINHRPHLQTRHPNLTNRPFLTEHDQNVM